MNKSRIFLVAVAIVGAGVLAPARANADAFDDARRIFAEAETLYSSGSYKQAGDKYEQAYRLIRSPLMFYNIAQARRLEFQGNRDDYQTLVAARDYYERFVREANPSPEQKAQAEANLSDVDRLATDEAKQRFGAAEQAIRLGRYEAAIAGYEAAYELSKRPGILFNLAQAQRKQFTIDQRLERLARAEDFILTYQRESKGRVAEETIAQILGEIRQQRAEYHKKRDAEAAAAAPAPMREARARYLGGDGAGALTSLAEAEAIKNNPRVVLINLYRLRGQAAVLAGRNDLALEAFKHYLAVEPAADGTGLSEAAAPVFAKAKQFWKDKKPIRLDHLSPGKVPPATPVSIPIRVASDPLRMIVSRELRYRQKGVKQWTKLALASTATAAKLPKTPLPLVGKSYSMEYTIAALDKNRAELVTLGSDTSPLTFLVTEDAIIRPPPLYKRWWFWAGAGAVVAGTIATYAIIQADGLPDTPPVGDVSKSLSGGGL